MSDERDFRSHEEHEGDHSLALGLLAGTALGVSVGLLFAPKAGSETRKQCKEQVDHLVDTANSGLHRARDTANDLAHKSRDAYNKTSEIVSKSAHEAQRYARDVANALGHVGEALTNRSSQDAGESGRFASSTHSHPSEAGSHRMGEHHDTHSMLSSSTGRAKRNPTPAT
jgi:gas vesicle protein